MLNTKEKKLNIPSYHQNVRTIIIQVCLDLERQEMNNSNNCEHMCKNTQPLTISHTWRN